MILEWEGFICLTGPGSKKQKQWQMGDLVPQSRAASADTSLLWPGRGHIQPLHRASAASTVRYQIPKLSAEGVLRVLQRTGTKHRNL